MAQLRTLKETCEKPEDATPSSLCSRSFSSPTLTSPSLHCDSHSQPLLPGQAWFWLMTHSDFWQSQKNHIFKPDPSRSRSISIAFQAAPLWLAHAFSFSPGDRHAPVGLVFPFSKLLPPGQPWEDCQSRGHSCVKGQVTEAPGLRSQMNPGVLQKN